MIFRNDYYFLSNMYPCPVKYNGIVFKCSESAFQAQKTVNVKEKIKIGLMDGFEARDYGKKLLLRNDWEHVKLKIMEDILIAKFRQNKDILEKLKQIPDNDLVEENTWCDNYWGVCNCPKCKNKEKLNHLGKILIKVKNKL